MTISNHSIFTRATPTLAEQMAAECKDHDLVAAFRLFADPRIFEAGMIALRDGGYVND